MTNKLKSFMKIILASDYTFLLNQGYALTGIPKHDMRIGYVTTASNVYTDKKFFNKVKQAMRDGGYIFEEIDIVGKSREGLMKFFSGKNVIHVEGGNTFYLLKAVRESGFDDVLQELLAQGKVYIGTSAGAYIMCPTIEVSTWHDDERFGVTDFSGLGYAPFVVYAHYTDEDMGEIKAHEQGLVYPLRILRDGQGILLEDGRDRFVGEGEEVGLDE